MKWTSPKTLGIALLVSLAVNLFLAGIMIGRDFDHHWRGGMMAHKQRPMLSMAPRWINRVLDEETAAALKPVWDRHKSEIKPRAKALHGAREAVREALKANPYDAEAYRRALDTMRIKRSEMEKGIHAAMIETMAQLSPEDRRKISEFKPRRRKFHKDRHLD